MVNLAIEPLTPADFVTPELVELAKKLLKKIGFCTPLF